MHKSYNDTDLIRYCKQTVLKAMNDVRAAMRGSNRLSLGETVQHQKIKKSPLNLTKGIDSLAEALILSALEKKLLQKKMGIKAFTVFSEEMGITTLPKGVKENDVELVIFINPIDGTEFIESLQGGWCLMAVYDRTENEVACVVAGDIFLAVSAFIEYAGSKEEYKGKYLLIQRSESCNNYQYCWETPGGKPNKGESYE
jgi:fructose-1,6-bisphosphatase/inositol monophosphatase family enzyme